MKEVRSTRKVAIWAALGVIASSCVWYLTPRIEVCVKRQRTDAQQVMSVLELYRLDNANEDCPTLQQLWDERCLVPSVGRHEDGGRNLWIECRDGLVSVKQGAPVSGAESRESGRRGATESP